MESPIAQPTYIFPAQEFMLHTLCRQSRARYQLCSQDEPEDILESDTALLLARSFQNTFSSAIIKTNVSVISAKLWSLSVANYVSTCAFYILWDIYCTWKSNSLMETEGNYSFVDLGAKFLLICTTELYFLRLQFLQIPKLSSPFEDFQFMLPLD